MQANPLSSILPLLAGSGPAILLCLVGIIFAIIQREKAPKAAIFVILSLIVLLVMMIVRPLGYSFLANLAANGDGNTRSAMFLAWNFCCSLISAVSLAGLIFAAFCDRQAPPGNFHAYPQQFGSVPPGTNPYLPSNPLPLLGGPLRPPQ